MTKLVKGKQNKEVLIEREPIDIESFKKMIRQMGLKVTKQRVHILEAMSEGRAHITAQELFEKLNKKHPEIGFATVYRFLKNMTEHSLVTEVRMGGFPARYELTPNQHHDHLNCTRCGKIVEFENESIEELQLAVAKKFKFKLTGHVLELYGECEQCTNKE